MPYRKKTEFFDDIWARFDRYEIVDGKIKPARGATLTQYEPWNAYRRPEGKETRRQPYHALLELPAAINPTTESPDQMRDALLAWCSEYGLLGVLLHRLETVVLPPRASESMMGPGVMTPKYIRTATGWKQDAPVLFEFSDAEKSMEPPEPPDTPGIFLRKEPGDFEISFESLETVRSQFFPDLPTSQDLPLPFSDEFWAHYAEPVHLFLNAATRLREATDGARMKASKADPGNMRVATGVAKLQALAAPVRTTLYKTQRGKFSVGWVCHSLLAAFAMMATLDLAEARLLRCARPDCGKYFVSKAKKARYCTDTCRKTVQMRRWRHRKEVEKRKES